MHKRMMRGARLLAAVFAVFIALVAVPKPALADAVAVVGGEITDLKGTITMYRESKYKASNPQQGSVIGGFNTSKGKVSALKSNNPKVAKVTLVTPKETDGSTYMVYINALKPGKAKVTYTYKSKKTHSNYRG